MQLTNLSRFVGSSGRSVIDQAERIDEISDNLTDTLHGLNREYPGLEKNPQKTHAHEDEIHNMAELYAKLSMKIFTRSSNQKEKRPYWRSKTEGYCEAA